MNLLDHFLYIEPGIKRSIVDVIGWWELRRIPFNLAILLSGIVAIKVSGWLSPGPEAQDSILPLSTLLFLTLINFCYTFGWITELFTDRKHSYAPKLFKLGSLLTISLIMLPFMIAAIGNFVRLISNLFTN